MNSTSSFDATSLSFDMKTMCRVCLSSNVDMIEIFSEINSEIVTNIEFCSGISLKKTNGLPTQICKTCIDNLSTAHRFKTLCVLTEETLQKLLETIKIEPDYEDSNTYNECDLNYHNDIFKENIDQTSDVLLRCRKTKLGKGRNHPEVIKMKRGPYKKTNPPRLKKYKFTKLTCESCDLKFSSKQQSDEHRRDFHAENISWICEICGKTFNYRGSHYTHVKSHLPPRYSCAHCDYCCSTKSDLEKHLRIHFGIKKYKCDKCQACFHTVSNLHDHDRRNHQRLKRFHCTICDLMFYDKTKLNRHIDSHNAIKRFTCDICHSSFTRRCHWKKHLEKQHNVSVPAQRPGRQKTNIQIEPVVHIH